MPLDKEIKVVFADDEIEIKDMREDLDTDYPSISQMNPKNAEVFFTALLIIFQQR
ncbi:MAG: hypothetical protein U9O96_00785 [Candidatus Thermoplasmatota archaeon]|nr:hypothetical protein [Candidatus Thermoplasmatota archaeon]